MTSVSPAVTTRAPFRVVIVGGSFAGLATARHLASVDECEVHIVEPKDYFEYSPGMPHLLAGSGAKDTIFSAMTDTVGKAKHTRGLFQSINKDSTAAVVQNLATNQTVSLQYDALVIATGVKYTFPIRADQSAYALSQRIEHSVKYIDQIKRAKTILVNGGGLIGVEVAAELAHRYRESGKTIIILNRSPLLNSLPARAGVLAEKWLKSNGVEVLIHTIESSEESSKRVVTKQGRTINYDLLIECTGSSLYPSLDLPRKSAQFMRPFNSEGLISINEYMQSTEHANIFACGDIVKHEVPVAFATESVKMGAFGSMQKVPAIRNAHLAESQAEIVAHNIRALVAAQRSQPSHMAVYPRDAFQSPLCPVLSCISLGRYDHSGCSSYVVDYL
jgi:apoptosis-inducing factor 2